MLFFGAYYLHDHYYLHIHQFDVVCRKFDISASGQATIITKYKTDTIHTAETPTAPSYLPLSLHSNVPLHSELFDP